MQIQFTPKSSYEQFGQQIISLLVENFSETFFVGGLVRNILLQKSITDIDIATSATPQAVVVLLDKHNIPHVDNHASFGVILVPFEDYAIEIATLRSEQYTSSRYPKVTFINTMTKDSERRDFTINSLYLQPQTNTITDPQHGLEDLTNKTIRCVGNAADKFTQDPLRIFRAYKLQLETNFVFDAKTEHALLAHAHLLQTISKEKIKKELQKISNVTMRTTLEKMLKSS